MSDQVSLGVAPAEIQPGGVFGLTADTKTLPEPAAGQRYVAVWTAAPSNGQFQLIDAAAGFRTVVANQETAVTFGTAVQWTPNIGAAGAITFTVQLFGPMTAQDFAALGGNPPLNPSDSSSPHQGQRMGLVRAAPPQPVAPQPVVMTRASQPATADEALWVVIRDRTDALSFERYQQFIDD